MIRSWLGAVEQVMLAAIDSKARVLGVLSPDSGSGVSTLCRMLAESRSSSGAKTLLINLTQYSDDTDDDWTPASGATQLVQLDAAGYDVLTARPTRATRAAFNNVQSLRELVNDELASYEAVFVDLPPVLDQSSNQINPLAAARACDAVVMVCMPGRTTHHRIKRTMEMMEAVGVQLGGTVLNDLRNPTLGSELAGAARRLGRILPGLGASLERNALASSFLNSRS